VTALPAAHVGIQGEYTPRRRRGGRGGARRQAPGTAPPARPPPFETAPRPPPLSPASASSGSIYKARDLRTDEVDYLLAPQILYLTQCKAAALFVLALSARRVVQPRTSTRTALVATAGDGADRAASRGGSSSGVCARTGRRARPSSPAAHANAASRVASACVTRQGASISSTARGSV